MKYINHYSSPLGEILLASDSETLTGLWFVGQNGFAAGLDGMTVEAELPVFRQAKAWLDAYFSGKDPGFSVPVSFIGTDFQREVWELLLDIPYGKTVSYAELAAMVSARRGGTRMSSRAVGNAASRNRISIIVPCHRVIGKDGELSGYAGGKERKKALLTLEGALT